MAKPLDHEALVALDKRASANMDANAALGGGA